MVLGESNPLTTIHANQEPAEDEEFIRRHMFREGHRQSSNYPNQVVDQEPALASKLVCDPASDESSTHSPNGEDGDGHGVHKSRGFVCHIFPEISLTMSFADKLFNDLKC